jgi:hypothetical protein
VFVSLASLSSSSSPSPLLLYYGAFGNNPLPLRLFFPKPGQYQMVLLGGKRYRFVLECGATGENGGVR